MRQSGKYRYLALPDRVGGGTLPAVEVVDLRRPATSGPPAYRREVRTCRPRSIRRRRSVQPLEAALRATLARGEQSILLLNRRGLRVVRPVRRVRGRVDLPALLHHAHLPSDTRAAGVSLLPASRSLR